MLGGWNSWNQINPREDKLAISIPMEPWRACWRSKLGWEQAAGQGGGSCQAEEASVLLLLLSGLLLGVPGPSRADPALPALPSFPRLLLPSWECKMLANK